jgi:hypothetical protein
MNDDLGHGPRLTDEEYDSGIVKLHGDLPPVPTRAQDRHVRRQALELAIDHRLGRDFPLDRREALWAIQQRVEKKRLRLIFKHLLRRFFPRRLARGAQGLAGYLVDEYAKVLSKSELESFFGAEEARRPALPIDPNRLRE